MSERIGVALSGGADSALAASLLLSQGQPVFALHLLLVRGSAAEEQARRAADVARKLGIQLEVIDAVDAFADHVIAPFCAEYASGRTPNPCVTCNRHIKFGLLLDVALQCGADRLATGHYARIARGAGGYTLLRAADHQADQSYFLYAVDPSALERLLFPLGELFRSDVRALAAGQHLARGRSSQDICFVAGRDYGRFVADRVATEPGDIVDTLGRLQGRHRGLPFYTVGQRHRLGVTLGQPAYVVHLAPQRNEVVIGTRDDLLCAGARLDAVRWLAQPRETQFRAQARIRFRARSCTADVAVGAGSAVVTFEEPQRAVAPGQSLVLYDGDTVLGGGVVDAAWTSKHDAE